MYNLNGFNLITKLMKRVLIFSMMVGKNRQVQSCRDAQSKTERHRFPQLFTLHYLLNHEQYFLRFCTSLRFKCQTKKVRKNQNVFCNFRKSNKKQAEIKKRANKSRKTTENNKKSNENHRKIHVFLTILIRIVRILGVFSFSYTFF